MGTFTEDDEDSGQPKTKGDWKRWFLNPLNLLLVFGLIIIIIGAGRWGEVELDRAFMGGFFLMLASLLARLIHSAWKNATPKLVTQTGWTTTTGRRIPIGNWYLYRKGEIDYGVTIKGTEGTLIVPTTANNRVGRCVIVTATGQTVPFEELPIEVQEAVEEYKMPPPYELYMAAEEQALQQLKDADEVSGLQNPSVGYLITTVKEQNRLISMFSQITKGKFKSVQDLMSAVSRIQMKVERGGFSAAVKRAVLEKPEDA